MENHESKDTVKLLMEEVRKNRGRNIELVRSDCTRIKAYGIQNNDAETLGFSYYCLGETYYIQNDIDKMIQNMTKAISYLVRSGQWELLAIVSATAGNATAAMDYYLEGMKLCQRYGISNVERRIQLNLGYLYLQNKEYDDARVCFHQAHHNYMAMQKKERHLASLTMIYTNLANCYMRMGDLKRTGEYIDSIARDCEPHFENIDYFKQYNDNYGHQEGDECVKAVARLLEQMQSEQIFCARYGGDEFIVIYCRMSAKEVYERAEKLRNDVIKLNREHLYSDVHSVVTISQGICYDVPTPGNKSWDFLHQADMLLYSVKKTARNHICMGDIRGQEIVTEK